MTIQVILKKDFGRISLAGKVPDSRIISREALNPHYLQLKRNETPYRCNGTREAKLWDMEFAEMPDIRALGNAP